MRGILAFRATRISTDILLFLIMVIGAEAQTSISAEPPFTWPVEELPLPFSEPAVHALWFDATGAVLWLGTPNEVARYAGDEPTWPNPPNPDIVIARSFAGANENLLIGTINGALYRWSPEGWTILLGDLGQSTFHLASDAHQGIWVGNSFHWPDSRLRYFRQGRLFEVHGGASFRSVDLLEVDPGGDLWLTSFGRLYRLRVTLGEIVEDVGIPVPGLRARDLAFRGDEVWLLGREGIERLGGNGWESVSGEGLDIGPLHRLCVDRDGRLWALGERGLAYRHRDRWYPVPELPVSASEGWPPVLAFDALGALWIGSSKGLWRLRLDRPLQRLHGEPAHLWVEGDRVWVANVDELLSGSIGSSEPFQHVFSGRVSVVASQHGNDSLWVLVEELSEPAATKEVDAPLEPGLYEVSASGVARRGGLPPVNLTRASLAFDAQGRIFAATWWSDVIWQWTGSDWKESVTAPRIGGSSGVPALALDADGRPWACLQDRLACLIDERWVMSEPISPPRPVKLNLHGSIVAAPDGGVYAYGPWRSLVRARLVEGKIEVTAAESIGLERPIPEAEPLLESEDQDLWLLAGSRLYRFDGERWWELEKLGLDDRSWRFDDLSVRAGRLAALARAADGTPWLLTAATGAAASQPVLRSTTPRTQVIDAGEFSLEYQAASWAVPRDAIRYLIELSDLSGGSRQRLWTRDSRREWRDLPHGGRYRVEVKAVDILGQESSPLVFERRVELPIAQRSWFFPVVLGLSALTAGGMGIAGYRGIRRFQAHGYRTVVQFFEEADIDRLATLRRQAQELGTQPSLAALSALGALLGLEIPKKAWPALRPRPWQRDCRIVLRAVDEEEWILHLPWEAAVAPGSEDRFLGRSPNVTLLRCPLREDTPPIPRSRPLSLLHLVASPSDEVPLDGANELEYFRQTFTRSKGRERFEIHSSADGSPRSPLTRSRFLELLHETPADAVHLTCHGRVRDGAFELLLEGDDGRRAPLTETQLVEAFHGLADRGAGSGRRPRLLILSACSGLGLPALPPPHFAARLLAVGLDGVVGFQFDLGSRTAGIFFATFYATWSAHGQIDFAAQRGRATVRALRGGSLYDFAAPVVFCANSRGLACPPP